MRSWGVLRRLSSVSTQGNSKKKAKDPLLQSMCLAASQGKLVDAARLWKQIKQDGPELTKRHFEQLAEAYVKGGYPEKCFVVEHEMKQAGMNPLKSSSLTLSCLIAWKKLKDWTKAVALIRKMAEKRHYPFDKHVATAIQICIDCDQIQEALALESLLSKQEPMSPFIANTLLRLLCVKGEVMEAIKLAIRARDEWGMKTESSAVSYIVKALLKEDHLDIAISFLTSWSQSEDSLRVATFRDILIYLTTRENWSAFDELVDKLSSNSKLDSEDYLVLISAMSHARKHDFAIDHLKKMQNDGIEVTSRHVFEVLRHIDPGMEGFEHEQLLNQLDAYRFLNDPNVLKWFAYRAIQRSDLEFFEKVFNEAKKLGSIPNHDLYVRLMKLYYKTNEFEKATKLFSEIQALGFPEDLKLKGMAILCYGKLGDFEMAKQIFLSVDTRVQARDIVLYGNLVSAALSCKEYESVQALVGQMSALGFEKTLPIYFSLIQIYCERGDLERISATIEELESNGHLLDRHHYSTIYLALLEHQHWNQARMFIQRCVEDGIYLPVKCIAATMEKLFDHGLSREWISAAGFHVTALKSLVFNKGVARNTV